MTSSLLCGSISPVDRPCNLGYTFFGVIFDEAADGRELFFFDLTNICRRETAQEIMIAAE
jgi:hypothetical protein